MWRVEGDFKCQRRAECSHAGPRGFTANAPEARKASCVRSASPLGPVEPVGLDEEMPFRPMLAGLPRAMPARNTKFLIF